METFGTLMQPHETVGIAEGNADEALPCGLQRICPGRAEMRRVADGNGAEPELTGKLNRFLHGRISRKRAMRMIGIERHDRAECRLRAQRRSAVDPAAFERLHVMGKQTDAMTVYAVARAVHHRARCSMGRRLIGADCTQCFLGKPGKLSERHPCGAIHLIHCESSSLILFAKCLLHTLDVSHMLCNP